MATKLETVFRGGVLTGSSGRFVLGVGAVEVARDAAVMAGLTLAVCGLNRLRRGKRQP